MPYADIYQKIRFKNWSTFVYAGIYFMTYIFFINLLVIGWLKGERNPMYQQAYHFDATPLPRYLALTVLNLWIGFLVIITTFGESNVIITCLQHANGRYEILARDTETYAAALISDTAMEPHVKCQKLQAEIYRLIQRNIEINDFFNSLHALFTFNIFTIFCLSSMMLCVLLYCIYEVGAAGFHWICNELVDFGRLP